MTFRDIINAVANDSSVIDGIAPNAVDVDLGPLLSKPGNYIFGDEDFRNGFVLFLKMPGLESTYEMHYLFTKRKRGKALIDTCRRAIGWMFTDNGATVICGATPRDNLPARVVSRALGGTPHGDTVDVSGRPCIFYTLERRNWAH